MSTITPPEVLPLEAGQRLGRDEFHRRYEAMPPGIRCELIDGIVHMPSPVGPPHSRDAFRVAGWLHRYEILTPGVSGHADATTFLGDETEVQPDLMLRIEPGRGGQTRTEAGYIAGAPELVVEIAHSSRSIDLGVKRAEYDRAGCREYIVFAIEPAEVFWHRRHNGRLVRVSPDADGLYRSAALPGLWLDPVAFLAGNTTAWVAALDRGLASAEHTAFVVRLAEREP